MLGAAAGAAAAAATLFFIWPQASLGKYNPITFRHGAVTSARFTPDGSFVYSASWDGRPYEVFLAREGSADARPLGLENGRILSVSPASEMAVLFGRQNISQSFGPRTLARVPVAGGARRDLLEGVIDADWIPGTNDLAVVRVHSDGRSHVEFPIGTKVHESAAAWSLRVSPDGQRIAFFEGPALFAGVPNAMITIVDRSGRASTVSRGWSGLGLAWAPSGREVWFTATHGFQAPSLNAVSLSGSDRQIETAPDWLVVYDISRDGRILMTRNTIRIAIACQPPGDSAERDLSWLMGSQIRDLSSDGQTLIFAELLGGSARGVPRIFRRAITGSAAIALGDGIADALSPDGKWTLTLSEGSWTLLPTGAGSARTLGRGTLARVLFGGWLPDGRHIVFTGLESGDNSRPRIYVQAIDGGAPRSITPEGVDGVSRVPTPDGRSVLGRSGNAWWFYPLDGGEPRPVPALTARDSPIQWSADGASVYAMASVGFSGVSRDVFRIDLATGRRSLWKTLAPADPVGVDTVGQVAITPDARAYCYSYMRRLGNLFIVDGLK